MATVDTLMKPLELPTGAWRMLARFARKAHGRVGTIALRPRDVVAANGHMMVTLPLPEDPARDIGFEARELWPWLGQKRKDGYGIACEIAAGERLAFRRVDPESAYERPMGSILTIPVAERMPDAALDGVLATLQEPWAGESPIFNSSYMGALTRLTDICGAAPAQPMRALNGEAIAFKLAIAHPFPGIAHYVVMRMRGELNDPTWFGRDDDAD